MNYFKKIDSPLGYITLQANDRGLLGAWFETQTTMPSDLGTETKEHPILQSAEQALFHYFNGQPITQTIPFAVQGTEFQKRVWNALTTIPFGETWSYQDLADAIGNSKAVRAVGLANGKNPISILVPCHRVIGKNGTLTGYAGGVDRKAWLLQHETAYRQKGKE